LYLSNAEEYWDRYSKTYRANIRALPFDDRSVVLRTLLTWSVNMDYRYNVQRASNYVEWLDRDWLRHVRQIAPAPPGVAARDVVVETFTDEPPDESVAAGIARRQADRARLEDEAAR
jgi:hypothetical protein